MIATNNERYGCAFPTQNAEVVKKQQCTNLERYGTSCSLRVGLKRYLEDRGVSNVSQLAEHRRKVTRTSLERYGTSHPLSSPYVRDKIKKTNVQRRGVEWVGGLTGTQEKIKQTNLERLGVEWAMQSPEVRAKVDFGSAARSRHVTMKANNAYALTESQPENACYVELCKLFGEDSVKRHVLVNQWDIDLFVSSANAYVQVDGSYWHGLDRSVEEIRSSGAARDRVIMSTVQRDKLQNEWFMNNGLRLVRITDKDVKAWQRAGSLARELNRAVVLQ